VQIVFHLKTKKT